MISGILNTVSVAAAFVFGVGGLYIILDSTIGRLKFLKSKFEWNGLQIKDFVFLAVAATILLTCCSFVKPY